MKGRRSSGTRPERADGRSVLEWFDGRIAAEIRLWEALDRQLLCPFQYFGTHDGVDLSGLRWRRGGYDTADLERVYTGDHARVRLVLQALRERIQSGEMSREEIAEMMQARRGGRGAGRP